MLHGSSRSDIAVRSVDISHQREWISRGMGIHAYVVSLSRPDIDEARRVLDELFEETKETGWNGYGSAAVHPLTYALAVRFLESLPLSMPAPEVNADPDGEISFDWDLGRDRLLAVSLGISGRLSFIYQNRAVRMRDTLWFLDQQIPEELVGLYGNLKR